MKKWTIYILTLLLLGACTAEEGPDIPKPPVSGGEPGDMTLSLKFPQTSPATYALTPEEENRVGSLEIFVFTGGDAANALNDTYAYSIKVPAGGITDSIGGSSVNGNIKKVPITLKSMSEKQRLILLANKPAGVVLASSDTVAGVSRLGDIVDKLKFSGASWRKDNLTGTDPAFPMWGQMTDSLLIHHSNTSLPSKIDVNMIRAVSRIEIGVDVNGSDPALGFGRIFKIDSVYLCNSTDSGYIAPHTDYLKKKPEVTATGVAYPRPAVNRIERVGYKFPADQTNLVRTIYTPEADTLQGTYKPAFLVVKAEFASEYYYYRVDFADGGKYKALLRNNSYLINIVGVRGEGYKLLHDAINAPVSSYNYSLILSEAELELNEVMTNEQYSLAYSSKHILLDWNESLNIPVKTDYPGGWTASATGDVSFSGQSGVAGGVSYITHSLGQNLDQPKTFTVHLAAGELRTDITVTQGIGSNSYIVPSGGSIQIPVNSANLSGDLLGGASDLKVGVVWQDGTTVTLPGATDNLSKSSILNIEAGIPLGNAVIALIKPGGGIGMVGGIAGGEIVWSWHVWVTDFNPSTAKTSNNGYIFMDRNLGATSGAGVSAYGLYYQWGRKDPFAPGHFQTGTPASSNLEEAIKNPKIFYTPTALPFDWIGTVQNNLLWNTAEGGKAAYDPCPFGWRVPPSSGGTDSPWYGFTNNSRNGITFPLAGGVRMADGKLDEAGTQGYVWSGSISGTEAVLFKCTTGSASHSKAYRANAYPVRCVKDVKR